MEISNLSLMGRPSSKFSMQSSNGTIGVTQRKADRYLMDCLTNINSRETPDHINGEVYQQDEKAINIKHVQ